MKRATYINPLSLAGQAHATTVMPAAEIAELTGRQRPADQIKALHELGFWMARLTPAGVSLPLEHYRAVCAGAVKSHPAGAPPAGPQMRPHPATTRRAEGTSRA